MPQPTAYVPATDFSAEEAASTSGRSTVRTAQLDAEFSAVKTTTDGVRTNLALIQRDDGEIRDQVVKVHTLHPVVLSLLNSAINPMGDWATTTVYAALDIVEQSGNVYICIEAHTSGTFSTDLAAGKWMVFSYNLSTDTELAAIAAVTSAADKLPYFTGSGTAAVTDFPSFGRSLVACTDLAAAQSLLAIANNGTFRQSAAGAVDRTVNNKLAERISALDFAASITGSDQTAAVQAALNALPAAGGFVHVNEGLKFNLRSLTLRQRCWIEYRVDDDTSTPGQASDLGSGEWVRFGFNSSYPTDPSGGAVNEQRYASPFHPALVLDVRKDVTSADAYLNGSQSRTEPARASLNIQDEQIDRFRLAYENYASGSNFSSAFFHAWRYVVDLVGIGTGEYSSVPAAGTIVTGGTSGAKGFVVAVDANSTLVLWFSGKFAVGDTLTDDDETTSATVTSLTTSIAAYSPIGQGLFRGNWGLGLPPDAVTDILGIGGNIAVAQTRSGTYSVETDVDHPMVRWLDSYENVTPAGLDICYDTTPAAALRRLHLRRRGSTANIGHIGAVRAATGFANSVSAASSSYNVSGIVRNTTGDYTITFDTAFVTADFMVSLTTSDPSDYAYVFAKTTTTLRIKVVTTGTTTPRDLTGVVDVVCHCGDI